MNTPQVLAELFRLTGALEPVSPATPADLDELRRRLAHSLFDLPGDGVSSFIPPDDEAARLALLELKAIVADVALERTDPAGVPRRAHVLRRELPLHSGTQPASFPARSAAHAVRRTFGPMLERRERFVFFDLVEAAEFLRVVRHGGAPFLLLPQGTAGADGQAFTFGAGSVWILADRLAPGAPGYVGLRVAEGRLDVREPAQRIGQVLHVGLHATCALSLVLDPPATPAPGEGPGQDAGLAVATRPRWVRFELTSQEPARIACDDGALSVYGATVALARGDDPAVVPALVDGVLVPFTPDRRELAPQDVRSPLLRPGGAWRIAAAGWRLAPALSASPDDLGEAADAGAMALELERGLTAAWRGLAGGAYTAERATVLADSHELALVAEGRTPRIARHELDLWRGSSLELLLDQAFRLHFVSSRQRAEACALTATAVAHLDRPLQADGSRPRVRMPDARVLVWHGDGGDEFVQVSASRRAGEREIAPLALANALLRATPPEELSLWGLVGGERQLAGAALRLGYGLLAILPFLPDPYAASFEMPREPAVGRQRARLTAVVTWSGPETPALALSIAPLDAEAANLAGALLPPGRHQPEPPDNERFLDRLFNRLVSPLAPPGAPLLLLDLSSHASQLGVGTAFGEGRAGRSALSVAGPYLTASLGDLRVFALPQVQWEPVRTHPPDLRPNFPQPLVSRDDGGPLLMGLHTDTVHLVPIAPEPLLRIMVDAAGQPQASFAVRFTLPFGIKAVAAAPRDLRPAAERPALALNEPEFGPLVGGLQVSLTAGTPAGIPGGAVQAANSTSVPPRSVLDELEGFFNVAFHPGDGLRRVPLSRIDFSGYGASAFSRWVNEQAAAVDVTKVEFDVMVGRTSYEVVEVQSILWPCMARVVRRITIRREGHGRVLRRDSGWVAATPGLFHRPDSACVVHPGMVRGMYEIREIRDTPRKIRLSSNVDLQVVYFDTDLAVEGAVRGHASEGPGPHGERVGFVPAQRQLGFVQLINLDTPQQTPLTPAQLRELLDQHGPVGGPVDCEVNIGLSEQLFRTAGVYVATAPAPSAGAPEFAVAAFGAPALPREGQWSVVRVPNDPIGGAEPEPIDPRFGVPLVRIGPATLSPAANASPHRFADPADLLRPAQPAVDYALLLGTDTFRVLFRRVKIEPGSRRLTSDLAPVLADAFAMTTATGLFPRLAHAIAFPSSAYELRILGGGRLRLLPSPLTHTMPPRVRDIVKAAGIHAFTEYRGGDRHQTGPARIALRFDSTAQPSWALTIGPVSTVTDIDPFGPLMRVITTLEASSVGPPRGANPLVEYGGALRPLEELIALLKEFGIPVDMLVETPNSAEPETAHKFKVAIRVLKFGLELLGKMRGKLYVGVEIGTTRAVKDPLMPGGSTELAVEIEGSVQSPILKPALYGGGLIRLQFITGYDPTEKEPIKREIKLAAAAVGSLGGPLIPEFLKVEGQLRYGYVFVADFAKKEYHPGVLIGFALEVEIDVPRATMLTVVKIAFEAEVIGLLKRIDEEEIQVKAELEVAGEVELFELVDVEYTYEVEWDQKLPMKLIVALAAAIQFGLVPLPPVPP